ncbi:MAG TPA: substrate-binding domain-containing protein [Balneolales bacterium]|nr:substrate-binding domain-containing protein [Balneolales bacterium]
MKIKKLNLIPVYLSAIFFSCLILVSPAMAQNHTEQPHISPPWTQPPQNGKYFTIKGIDNVPDLHGDVNNPQLVVFFAGNQFMVIHDLIKSFKAANPKYKRVFVETLPPGILAQQIEQGALVVGNMRISLKPDIYTAGKGRIHAMQQKKHWFRRTENYARNRLALMVYKDNPDHIHTLKDLAKNNIRVTMPNPKWEGIAKHIEKAYVKAGGQQLLHQIMVVKRDRGTTMLTRIHHRQSPIRIMEKKADVGPVWYTEAYFQKMIGNPIDMITIPDRENVYVTYAAASMKNAPHPKAAKAFLRFLKSKKGQQIYQKYRFLSPKN